MCDDDAKAVALFKYGVIAPLVGGFLDESSKEAYYRSAALKKYTLPDGREALFKPATIKKWFLIYTSQGIDGLRPKERSDKGKTRTLSEDVCKQINAYREKFPKITGQKIYEKLLEDGVLKFNEASIDSIYRYLKENHLTKDGMPATECLAFEFEHANDCWQADTVDGPYIRVKGHPVKTYLVSFIDDASRLHPHGEFFFSDDAVNVQKVFYTAIRKRGLPRRLFDDNGSPYRNNSINWICAQLGVVLIHSTVYRPRGKGKEERSHRTANQRFLDCTDFSGVHSLDELNQMYWNYIDTEYHHKAHTSLGISPLERYMQDFHLIRFVEPDKLEEAFYHQAYRIVNATGCVSLFKIRYEVPQKYIGQKISLRYKPGKMDELYIYDEKTGTKCETVHPVRLLDNKDRKRRKNISYAENKEDTNV